MELKDILSYLDAEGVESLDAFKEKFTAKFGLKSEIADEEAVKTKVTGALTGAVQTKLKSTFGLDSEEIKGKKWEEILELGSAKLKSKIQELEETSLKTSDSALKDLNEKLEKANKLVTDYKESNNLLKQEAEKNASEYSEKIKSFKIGSVLKDSNLKIAPKLAELNNAEKFYFENQIKENVIIDFDENDSPIVRNKEGKRWEDPNKVGSFLSPEQVIEQIAAKEGYIKKNNASQSGQKVFAGAQQATTTQQSTEVPLHPNAVKAAQQAQA